MKKTVVLLALLLAGCVDNKSETVYLTKGPSQVQCGPYDAPGLVVHQEEMDARDRHLRECVHDYQIQGYQRVPAP